MFRLRLCRASFLICCCSVLITLASCSSSTQVYRQGEDGTIQKIEDTGKNELKVREVQEKTDSAIQKSTSKTAPTEEQSKYASQTFEEKNKIASGSDLYSDYNKTVRVLNGIETGIADILKAASDSNYTPKSTTDDICFKITVKTGGMKSLKSEIPWSIENQKKLLSSLKEAAEKGVKGTDTPAVRRKYEKCLAAINNMEKGIAFSAERIDTLSKRIDDLQDATGQWLTQYDKFVKIQGEEKALANFRSTVAVRVADWAKNTSVTEPKPPFSADLKPVGMAPQIPNIIVFASKDDAPAEISRSAVAWLNSIDDRIAKSVEAAMLSYSPYGQLSKLDAEATQLAGQIEKDSGPQAKIDRALGELSREYDECSKELKKATDLETKKRYISLADSLGPNIELLKKSKERISTTAAKLVNLKKALADISAFYSSMSRLAGQNALDADVRDILKEILNIYDVENASKAESRISIPSKTDPANQQSRAVSLKLFIMPPEAKAGKDLKIPDLKMDLVYVQEGSFQMGADIYSCEKPVRTVSLTKPFWIGRYEVTQLQWEAVMGNNPSRFKGANRPVEQVTWDDCVLFCDKLTDRDRKSGRLPSGYVYRLPSEVEWEYAARGGNKGNSFTYSGGNNPDEVAWCSKNSRNSTQAVGQKKANELGLYDMSGNVMERCHDYYPRSNSDRICRGGSWRNGANFCRSSYRIPDYWDKDTIGFRLVVGFPLP